MRNNFDLYKNEAIVLFNAWNIKPEYVSKRKRHTKKHYDEITEDQRLQNPEDNYRVNVYISTIDITFNCVIIFAVLSRIFKRLCTKKKFLKNLI